jgi:hypothetical protein
MWHVTWPYSTTASGNSDRRIRHGACTGPSPLSRNKNPVPSHLALLFYLPAQHAQLMTAGLFSSSRFQQLALDPSSSLRPHMLDRARRSWDSCVWLDPTWSPCNPRNLPDLEPADRLRCSSCTQTRFSSEQEWSDSSPIAQSNPSFRSKISTLPSTYFASESYSLPICLQFITWLPIQLSWVRSAVLPYHHNNGNNGKQDWKHYANLLKPGATSPDIGPNLDPFGSR